MKVRVDFRWLFVFAVFSFVWVMEVALAVGMSPALICFPLILLLIFDAGFNSNFVFKRVVRRKHYDF